MAVLRPSDVIAPPKREAGGDNEVPRDSKGRPLILVPCPSCDSSGRVPSERRPGSTVLCPKRCDGQSLRKAYTRTTTYIDVLEDKSNLMAWGERMTLIGAAKDQRLLDRAEQLHREIEESSDPDLARSNKNELNRRAKVAKSLAGAERKADKGTHLHALSELVDQGLHLPTNIPFQDVIDMDAYKQSTTGFEIVHMEKLVVHDELKVAGTPDRVSRWVGEQKLCAPDGSYLEEDELLITDLKTGTVEYGALKMAMQLAIYSRAQMYDKDTGKRSSIGNVRQDWGIIMNLPAGSGECTLYWVDLEMGWRAVELATQVRSIRSEGRKALSRVAADSPAV